LSLVFVGDVLVGFLLGFVAGDLCQRVGSHKRLVKFVDAKLGFCAENASDIELFSIRDEREADELIIELPFG
jgi:hypothetical protein